MSKLKEFKCERCGDLFDQTWCLDDQMERDMCQICTEHTEAEEAMKEHIKD